MTKILIIRFSSIGDVVLTSPILRCLKMQLNEVEIHYLTKNQFEQIIETNPYVTKVFTVEKDELHRALRELKAEKYDYVIDLHNNLRTAKVKRSLRVKSYSFPKLNVKKLLLTRFKINQLPKGLHVVDRYFETVKELGVKNDRAGIDFFIPNEDMIDVSKFGIRENYLTFSIAAKFGTKRLPLDKMIELTKMLKGQVVLLGGILDMENAEAIEKECPNVVNLCGQLKLNKTASVIQQARKLLCFDTGLMHIGSAFQKPIVSVWGNTVEELGMYPYMPSHPELFSMHEVADLKCRPCSKIGYAKCPKKHFKCMRDQNLEAIAQDVNEGFVDPIL